MSIINVVDINLSPCIIGLEFGAWVAACRPDPARSLRQREGLCRLPLSASRQKGEVGGKEERDAFSSPASPPPRRAHAAVGRALSFNICTQHYVPTPF